MKTVPMLIAAIRRDGGTQIRAALDEDTVAEYAQVIRDGGEMPPVNTVFDGKAHWLVDGFHRIEAALRAGKTRYVVEPCEGTLESAILEACSANQRHGLRRTNADKRRAVETMLAHPVAKDWSARRIAEHIGVTHAMVAEHRVKVSTVDTLSCVKVLDDKDLRRETPRDEALPGTRGDEGAGVPVDPANARELRAAPAPDEPYCEECGVELTWQSKPRWWWCLDCELGYNPTDKYPAPDAAPKSPSSPPIDMLGLTAPADWLEGVAVVRAALVKLDSTMRTMQVLASVLPKGMAQRLTAKLQEAGALARAMQPAVACKACKAKGCAVCDKRGWLTVEATKSMHPDALVV